MSNLLEVYQALAEFGRKRAAQRAAAGQSTQQTADVHVVTGNTSAAGKGRTRKGARTSTAQV